MNTILDQLMVVIDQRKSADPDQSYVARLMAKAPDGILKKIAEESGELILASKNGDHSNIVHELADLWFHSLVMLSHHGISHQAVLQELERRFGLSGLEEKARR